MSPWWNSSCKDAVQQQNIALKLFRQNNTPENLINLKKARAKSKFIIKQSKKSSWKNYVSSINENTNPSQVWKKIRGIQGNKSNNGIPHLVSNDTVINNDHEIAKIIAENFEAKFRSGLHPNIANTYTNNPLSCPIPSNQDIDSLNLPFSHQELITALKSCKNSAAGPDDLPYIFLKKLDFLGQLKLLELFNLIWTSNMFPSLWRLSIIIPLKKPDQPTTSPKSYRPISLTCTMCKVMEKMINKRLIWYLDKYNILSEDQSGFRRHRSTKDNLITLQTHISNALNKKQQTILATFDIEGAFDTIHRNVILEKLSHHNINGNIFFFIKNFLSLRSFKVSVNGILSSTFNQTDVLPQGSVLSPTLFNLVTNDLCSNFSAPIRCTMYADDLVLYCHGQSVSTTSSIIQSAVNSLSNKIKLLGLSLSPTKSKVINFSKSSINSTPNIIINNVPLQVVNHCKILGMIFDSRLNWKRHILDTKSEGYRRLNIIKTLSHFHWGADETSLLKIYRSLIRSKLDYGCFVYICI